MPNIIVGNGTTLQGTQSPGVGFDLVVLDGGAIVVPEAIAVDLDGNNKVTVAGDIIARIPIWVSDGMTTMTVAPTGQIIAHTEEDAAIEAFRSPSTTGQIQLTNSGFIGADSWRGDAMDLGDSFDHTINFGVIQGFVYLNGGDDDLVVGGGEIRGMVFGGEGDDTLRIDHIDHGSALLRFLGEGGIDWLNLWDFGTAVWIDLDYVGTNVWTRDDQNLTSGAWRQLAEATGMEVVVGTRLSDYLSGNDAANTFFYTGGLDTILGDGGIDELTFRSFGGGVWVDLDYSGYEAWELVGGVWRAIADVQSIENLVGSFYADTLIGTNDNNVFNPWGGSDTVMGEGGSDRLIYEHALARDTFDGGAGTDSVDFSTLDRPIWIDLGASGLEGWTRGATLTAGTWAEALDLTAVEDLVGSSHSDILRGNAASNWIQGGNGDDTLVYTGGFDWLYGDGATDTASFEPLGYGVWVDLLYPGSEVWRNVSGTWTQIADLRDIENLTGSSYDDYLNGNAIGNVIKGGAGNDSIAGGTGSDLLEGGTGADTFIYRSLSDISGPFIPDGVGGFTPTSFDIVPDFQTGADKIDLRAIPDANLVSNGNQDFVWSGSGAAGTVTFGITSGGLQGLLFYVDGAAGPDFFLYTGALVASGDVLLS